MQAKVHGHRQETEGAWRLQLAEALRQAVLRGQTVKVHQLLRDGAPLVTDTVMCILSLFSNLYRGSSSPLLF